MATVSRGLPQQPHLDVPKREARELLKLCRSGNPEAIERVQRRHPKFNPKELKLSEAQLVIAGEYGFKNWTQLKERIAANTAAGLLDHAIRSNDQETVTRLLKAHPNLLHIPLVSGNWGPPMSHAANLGQLEMIKTIASLGARDFQHAFDRALLQGELDCARWLHAQGAKLLPGIVMGGCECLTPEALRFLHALNAPFTDGKGDPLAPLALTLETYNRAPERKHECLTIFQQRGYQFPDTPIMAFHLGDIARLKQFLHHDRSLLNRRFHGSEIYPPELGCPPDGKSGMCGTPIVGTTLLHLAIDFDEREIFDLLIAEGADVNARALIDAEGFGGQTPLFNAVISCAYICGRQRDAYMARVLLERGASSKIRTTLRKFLDWIAAPHWHEAREVTALEWGQGFPEQNWVNKSALKLLDEAT
jgi:hypothetical protein